MLQPLSTESRFVNCHLKGLEASESKHGIHFYILWSTHRGLVITPKVCLFYITLQHLSTESRFVDGCLRELKAPESKCQTLLRTRPFLCFLGFVDLADVRKLAIHCLCAAESGLVLTRTDQFLMPGSFALLAPEFFTHHCREPLNVGSWRNVRRPVAVTSFSLSEASHCPELLSVASFSLSEASHCWELPIVGRAIVVRRVSPSGASQCWELLTVGSFSLRATSAGFFT